MEVEVLIIPISSPLLIGIYQKGELVKSYEVEGKTSDVLPNAFHDILNQFSISTIYYISGPGSYMSIKVAYLFLQTLSIVQKLHFFATDGFYFNGNSPIKALGKKYFFKQHDGTIKIDFLNNNTQLNEFKLPKILDRDIFDKNTLPKYNLPAI